MRGGVRTDGEGGPAGGWVTERTCGKEGARVNEWARGKGESECEREEQNGGWLVHERQEARARKREREGKRLEAGARIDSRVALYGEVRKLQPEDSSCLLSPPREKE